MDHRSIKISHLLLSLRTFDRRRVVWLIILASSKRWGLLLQSIECIDCIMERYMALEITVKKISPTSLGTMPENRPMGLNKLNFPEKYLHSYKMQ
jgi:hypothetical protein